MQKINIVKYSENGNRVVAESLKPDGSVELFWVRNVKHLRKRLVTNVIKGEGKYLIFSGVAE